MTDRITATVPMPGAAESSVSERLPVLALLALAMTAFLALLSETLPAGLLPQIARDLNISEVMTGQLVTVYAIGSILTAIPLTALTSGWRRRNVLLLAIIGFLIFNTATALSPNYMVALASRFVTGMAAGLAWGLMAGYARRMVSVEQQGRAMAIAMIGTPLALSLGVPLGTLMGGVLGWRSIFGIMSGMAVVLVAWVLLAVPDYPGQKNGERLSIRQVFMTPGVRPILAVIVAWMLAHNILYTYIAPFLAPSGLRPRVDLVLLVYGVGSLAGIWLVSQLIDRWLRPLVLGCIAAFALVMVALGLAMDSPIVIYVSMAIWGITFGGAGTLLQTASADAAGDGMDVAQAMVATIWNVAIAGGGLAGGMLLDGYGAASFPWAMLALLMVALTIAWRAHRHSFKPGRRSGGAVHGH
ncbi:MFS transporter [Janthinobacterium lividum]|uniref:MFS transporter n=1 Tax=Janthinobacterium lividum TaxID=29581 RepID=UPI0008931006|nr:MFS transporter [Janthinobacterium lividum]MCC7711771.1 MFS transporter [Janthinobacterium lividum]OEZ58422.1 purine efflux pump PbuE [Janthinobacterium lividum]WQE27532.1 MFS transporter [Janthinobacterium lividum]STQ98439.1 Purine efflux pump PbuE [Janthinobacterium lividum]